jgi:hypothetical protein
MDTNSLDIWTHKVPHWIGRIFYIGIQSFAKFWHNYEIHGLENVTEENCLLVGYHSRCTIDGVYATAFLQPTTIMSPIFFAVPLSTTMFSKINCVSSHSKGLTSDDHFINIISTGGRPVLLFPGGHHECYKHLNDKYIVNWKEEPGYARIMLAPPNKPGKNIKVIPFFTHNCEDIYPTTDWWYEYSGKMVINDFHDYENGKFWLLPILLPKSLLALGFIILPRPVKLDLYIGKPLTPLDNETSIEFAERVRNATQKLIDDTINKHKNDNVKERTVLGMLLHHPLYFIFVIFQNTIMWSTIILLNIICSPLLIIIGGIQKLFFINKNKKHLQNGKKTS